MVCQSDLWFSRDYFKNMIRSEILKENKNCEYEHELAAIVLKKIKKWI